MSVLLDNSKSIKRKEVSKAADKGAPSEWRASTVSFAKLKASHHKWNFNKLEAAHAINHMKDATNKRSSVVDYSISPTLASQVLALTWQRDMWLHVAYGV